MDRITRGETPITYRELRQILSRFGFEVHGSKDHKVAITKNQQGSGLLRRRPQHKVVMSIDWPGDGRTVSIDKVKHIRRTLALCEQDGVTSDAFYEQGVRVDRFINEYRQVLRRLASR